MIAKELPINVAGADIVGGYTQNILSHCTGTSTTTFDWPLHYGRIPNGTGFQRGQNEIIRQKRLRY